MVTGKSTWDEARAVETTGPTLGAFEDTDDIEDSYQVQSYEEPLKLLRCN